VEKLESKKFESKNFETEVNMNFQICSKYEKGGECCKWLHCAHYACVDVTLEEEFKTRFCATCRMGMVRDIDVEARLQRETKLAHVDEGPQFLYTGTAYMDGTYRYEYVNEKEIFGSRDSPDEEETIHKIGLHWLYNVRHTMLEHKEEPPYQQKTKKQTTLDNFVNK
jgi:hypothetical protein